VAHRLTPDPFEQPGPPNRSARLQQGAIVQRPVIDSGGLWRVAADAMVDSLAILDSDGTILAVNEAWRSMAQHVGSGADRVGESYLDVCDRSAGEEPAAARAARAIRSVLRRRESTAWTEYQLEERWYRMSVRACDESQTRQAAVVVRHEDITDRLLSELAADAARTYLDAVTDSMGEGLFVLDVEGRLRMMNPAAEDMLGWQFEAIEGRVMHDLAHFLQPDGTDLPRAACPILRAHEAGEVIRVADDTFIKRDGSRLPVAYTASPLHGEYGQGGCVVVFMDVTHLRAEEERLRRQVAELSWIHRVEEALDGERLLLYAQPIVRLSDGEVVRHELLLRIQEPDATASSDGSTGGSSVVLSGAQLRAWTSRSTSRQPRSRTPLCSRSSAPASRAAGWTPRC
jgi:PAS domain S-box-containing protein